MPRHIAMLRGLVLCLVLLLPSVGKAGTLTVRNLFAAEYRDLTRDLAAALQFKQTAPPASLGPHGFEAGIEVAATDIDEQADYWRLVTDAPPDHLIIPKLRVLKGLPGRVDGEMMLSYLPSRDIFLWGIAGKWTAIEHDHGVPATSIRLSLTDLQGVEELDFTTIGLDLAAGYSWSTVEPYVGIGVMWVSSQARVRAEQAEVLVTEREEFATGHAFAGFRLYLPLVAITAELDWAERPTLSARLVFAR
ncbi:MAG: hypothetical protein PVF51_01625 [Nitrospirota bacterium]|jgi:hypothetical protein